jgi:hypothetical protein
MNDMLIMCLNMDKNIDRWLNIEKILIEIKNKYNVNYIRIPAIDGNTMDDNDEVRNILQIRPNLLNTEFKCIESNDQWIYDGSISKSFPGLIRDNHLGTKGLTLSNMKAFSTIKDIYKNYKWYLILEDDAEITIKEFSNFRLITKYGKFNNYDVVLLDNRGGKGGTCAMMYKNNIIDKLIEHMHPLSNFSIINEETYKKGANLWDWKLWVFLDNYNIKYKIKPLFKSGKFKSTIS